MSSRNTKKKNAPLQQWFQDNFGNFRDIFLAELVLMTEVVGIFSKMLIQQFLRIHVDLSTTCWTMILILESTAVQAYVLK